MRTARSSPATASCSPFSRPAENAPPAAAARATLARRRPPLTGRLLRGGHRLREDADAVYHHLGVSAFATHAVIDQRSAVKIPTDIPPEIAALFGCAVLTGVGAVLNTASVGAGESVAVYGLGGVGLSAVLGAVLAGAQPIIAIDPVASKRALATLELGASFAFTPEEAHDGIQESTAGGADVVIETAGKAAVLAAAATRRGGRTVTVGLPNPQEMLSIQAVSLVGDGKTLMGSYMGSSIPSRDIPRYIALWRAGRLPVHRLLTSTSPYRRSTACSTGLRAERPSGRSSCPDQ